MPHMVWSAEYEIIGSMKPGQYSPSSRTTPTILGHGEYVAIGDNATQLHVVVYRTAEWLGPKEERVVCQAPVFGFGLSGVEDSFVGSRRSIVLVNNYGASVDSTTFLSAPSEPGVARVDIAPNGKSCEVVWTAVDFPTGETVWQRRVGTGRWFDGYWPLAFLGPNGIGYMATYGGLVAIRDTP
jgi:hypothetical protein